MISDLFISLLPFERVENKKKKKSSNVKSQFHKDSTAYRSLNKVKGTVH